MYCDVSWISLFESEKEILYNRGYMADSLWSLDIIEDSNGQCQWIFDKNIRQHVQQVFSLSNV